MPDFTDAEVGMGEVLFSAKFTELWINDKEGGLEFMTELVFREGCCI